MSEIPEKNAAVSGGDGAPVVQTEAVAAPRGGRRFDPGKGMQLALLLDIGVRLLIWTGALAVTMWLVACWDLWPMVPAGGLGRFKTAWDVSQRVGHVILIFNVAYILWLLAIRALVPTPRAGRISTLGRRPDRQLLYSLMLGILSKARYQAPFPGFLVQPLANIVPLRWLFNLQFGPKSGSVFFLDPEILDPTAVKVGRNVTIGYGSAITAHLQYRDGIDFRPVVIEDDVLIGAFTGIGGGVHIKRGAVVRGYSMVLPGTVIGENEYWAGIPARRVREGGESLKP